jgi:hypothetical protein
MARYKQKAGLSEVKPEEISKAEGQYARGMQLMKRGQLSEALAVFNEVHAAAAGAFGFGGGRDCEELVKSGAARSWQSVHGCCRH